MRRVECLPDLLTSRGNFYLPAGPTIPEPPDAGSRFRPLFARARGGKGGKKKGKKKGKKGKKAAEDPAIVALRTAEAEAEAEYAAAKMSVLRTQLVQEMAHADAVEHAGHQRRLSASNSKGKRGAKQPQGGRGRATAKHSLAFD